MARNVGEQYSAIIPVKMRSSDTRSIAEDIRVFPSPFAEGNYQFSTTTRSTENRALGQIKTRHKYLTPEMRSIRGLYLTAKQRHLTGGAADQWIAKRLGITRLDLAAIVKEMEQILKNS